MSTDLLALSIVVMAGVLILLIVLTVTGRPRPPRRKGTPEIQRLMTKEGMRSNCRLILVDGWPRQPALELFCRTLA